MCAPRMRFIVILAAGQVIFGLRADRPDSGSSTFKVFLANAPGTRCAMPPARAEIDPGPRRTCHVDGAVGRPCRGRRGRRS